VSEISPEARLWNMLRGALTTKALGIAADLGVADALADGPRDVAALAEQSGADPQTLHRILRALASDGVFAEGEPGVFRNTESSALLRTDATGSWAEFAHLFGGVFYDGAGTMDPTTRSETFTRTFDADFWSWLAQRAGERAAFDAAMAGGKESHAARLAELGWRDDETVVDVGGGNGALLRALLAEVPGLRGVILDLPETDRDEEALGERITFVAGSFFEEMPSGDTYILSGILHDCDDEAATTILKTIRAAAPPNARLLVIDAVIPPGNEPHGSKWLDLLMLVLAGGRERTDPQWRRLLEGADFEPIAVEDGLIQARCR
jgi:O-methyltransferase domain/Dimerisation domain